MFLSRKAKFTTFLSQFVAKRKKRIGRKILVRIYAARKSHRLCQPGARYWSVPGNKTRWRTSSKYVDIQSRFRKCARSFDFCDESSLVIQCWTWSAWTCVFVFYLLVGRQTMIRDWYGAFLRILKLSTFFFRKSIFSLEMVSFVLSLSRAALFQEIASQKEKIHL